MTMRAARMYGYKQPLRLEEIPIPSVGRDEVLVKVGGAGMCRTDFQLIDGYFDNGLEMEFPITPGHEVAGWVDGIGGEVPKSSGLSEGDQVVVYSSWVTGRAGSVTRVLSNCARTAHGWVSDSTVVIRSTCRSTIAT
jgi:propanol-preferring alcohol dehydrogenase